VNTFEDYKKITAKANVDVIFFGSSHTNLTFNPLIINEKCNTISFNLGSVSLLLFMTDLVLNESIEYTKPKLVVLEVFTGLAEVRRTKSLKSYQLRVLDEISNCSKLKFNKVNYYFNNNEFIDAYFPATRNHKKWKAKKYFDLSKKIKSKTKKFIFKYGYFGYLTVLEERHRKEFEGFPNLKNNVSNNTLLTKKVKKQIDNFIKIAKNNGIDVLIVTSPDLKANSWDPAFCDELSKFCNSQNINYLNLNNYYSQIGLDLIDFMDPNHLNINGGKKISEFLAKYINNNYLLPNRSNEPLWKDLKKELKELNLNEITAFNRKLETKKCEIRIKKEIINSINIDSISIISRINNFDFKIKFNNNINLLKKYKLGIQVFTKNKNNLSKRSKSKGWSYDKKDVIIENTDSSILNFTLTTRIIDINKIKLFLFNKEKYTGVVGKPIIIENIEFL
jgi:hypothetical protein